MTNSRAATGYRFGVFEVDSTTRELRRNGVRVKLHAQPFQVLVMLLERPGTMVTREEISRQLWPEGTFVDYEHGVNSAVNRLREALGDKSKNPRFVETLARRGYRFLVPVELLAPIERIEPDDAAQAPAVSTSSAPITAVPTNESPPEPIHALRRSGILGRVLSSPEDLPSASHSLVQTLFVLLQVMYLGFYVGALANLGEISELLSLLPFARQAFLSMIVTASILIPVRIFLLCAALFHAPGLREKYLRMWAFILPFDLLWSVAPFLLLHHIPYGLALACVAPLVYAPFAQRSLILMGAGAAKSPDSALST